MSQGRRRCSSLAMVVCCGLVGVYAPTAWAQSGAPPASIQLDSFVLSLDRSIHSLKLPPGGFIRVSGVVISEHDGASFDAASETTSNGHSEAGLIDPVASGLELQDSNPALHTYTYSVGNVSGASCSQVGLQPPCLALRLPQIASSRSRDVSELRESLSGSLRVELHQAAITPVIQYSTSPVLELPTPISAPSPSSSDDTTFWLALAGVGVGVALCLGFLFLAFRRRRPQNEPLARVRASAKRLERKLSNDEVKARLLTTIRDLSSEAGALAQTEKKLEKVVQEANPEALEKRKKELLDRASELGQRGGEEAGQSEMKDAAQIVESQIERCRKWEMQRWRSAARLERIATRLEALEVELNDPSHGTAESKQELIDVLQEELDLARAGEREARKLLVGDSKQTGKRSNEA